MIKSCNNKLSFDLEAAQFWQTQYWSWSHTTAHTDIMLHTTTLMSMKTHNSKHSDSMKLHNNTDIMKSHNYKHWHHEVTQENCDDPSHMVTNDSNDHEVIQKQTLTLWSHTIIQLIIRSWNNKHWHPKSQYNFTNTDNYEITQFGILKSSI